MIIPCHLLDLVTGEAKISAVLFVQDRVDFQIVQAAENALLGHPEDSGQKAEGQVRIVLETSRKQVSHELDHIIIESLQVSLLNGCIILVNDDDSLDPVMGVEHLGKPIQGQHHFSRCSRPGDNLLIISPIDGAA